MLKIWQGHTQKAKVLTILEYMKQMFHLSAKRTILNQQLTVEKTLSRLLTFETIQARTYYQAMSEGNLLLLEKENQPQLKRHYLNLSALEQRYLEIQEKYFLKTDKEGLEKFISTRKRDMIADLDMMALENAFVLFKYEHPSGEKTLAEHGISGSYEEVERKLRQKRTKYNFDVEKRAKQIKEKVNNDYYIMLAKVREKGYKVQHDMLLVEWCGILTSLKESNGG